MEALQPCQQADRVSELMTPKPVTVSPETPVGEVFELMDERRIRHIPVVDDEGELQGIVSQRDLLGHAGAGVHPTQSDWDGATAAGVMNEAVDTVSSECCAAEAARHMLRTKRGSLPVVDRKLRVVGIVTEADFVRRAMRGQPPCTCGGVHSGI
ncbi:MAG: CBS domain-containing protein [Deltaproteobacteria bacterium]|nr:CBS domain-containing protein [Deltaproteobacteria bacterium]MBW2447940.1 CBS domain-containing protein [Deltaproteobacteria bacterium]